MIRLAHFYAKAKAEAKAKAKKLADQRQKDISNAAETGRKRRKDSKKRADAAARKTTQGILPFGIQKGRNVGFTLRF